MIIGRAALLLGVLAMPAHAQSLLGRSAPGQETPGQASPGQASPGQAFPGQAPSSAPLPKVLTPLGSTQGALPSAPAQPLPPTTLPPPPVPIQSQQLPVLTPAPTAPTTPGPAQGPAQGPVETPVPGPPEAASPAPLESAPSAPVPVAGVWQPRGSIVLGALDKVTARSTQLTGHVGDTLHFGSLSIVLKACVGHPADMPQDFAAWLDITDSHPGAPAFHGWMLAQEPSLSMLQHPVYDIRVMSCRD